MQAAELRKLAKQMLAYISNVKSSVSTAYGFKPQELVETVLSQHSLVPGEWHWLLPHVLFNILRGECTRVVCTRVECTRGECMRGGCMRGGCMRGECTRTAWGGGGFHVLMRVLSVSRRLEKLAWQCSGHTRAH